MAFLDETGLAELWALVKAKDAGVLGVANGKAQIATGSYVGTGKGGSDNPSSLTFGFEPKFMWLFRDNYSPPGSGSGSHWYGRGGPYLFMKGASKIPSLAYEGGTIYFTFSGNSVTWYSTAWDYAGAGESITCAPAQMNASGTTYYYVAIG